MQHIQQLYTVNVLHDLMLLICELVFEIVVHFDDVFVVQLTQYLVLLFRSHLLLDVIKTGYFDCEMILLFGVIFLVTHIYGRVHTLANHLALIVELMKLPFALLLVPQLVQLFGTVFYETQFTQVLGCVFF